MPGREWQGVPQGPSNGTLRVDPAPTKEELDPAETGRLPPAHRLGWLNIRATSTTGW
jgi:hypothetical protein